MGIGDQLIATGLAKGAADRGKRVAFGNGNRVMWDQHSEVIFRGNPNIAPPGTKSASQNIEWVRYFKGCRIYNEHDVANNRWIWNYDFKAIPGEVYFSHGEKVTGDRYGKGFILIEPEVPAWKSSSPNKDWGRTNYQSVADNLRVMGYRVLQFGHERSGRPLRNVEHRWARSFRDALAIMRNAALYIGPEGGLHHGAAAVGIPAVVLFGGFIPPQVTGYDAHTNLTGGAEACGSLAPCQHCREAMAKISVDEVFEAAKRLT